MNPLRTLVIAGSLGAVLAAGNRVAEPTRCPSRPSAVVSRPLVFEANRGQTDESVRFLARGGRCTAFLTPTETVLPVRGGALRIRPEGANEAPRMDGVVELPAKANYFVGSDPSRWRTNVPTFDRVRTRDLYPGIDVEFHRSGAGLEYDFVVAPGADPSQIAVDFDGACSLALDADGDLRIGVGSEVVIQRRPIVYQQGPDGRLPVDGRYVVGGDRSVSFAVGEYDRALPLVLDPVLDYATYLGRAGDEVAVHAVRDAQGDVYVVGYTTSSDFPAVSAYDGTYNGAGQFAEGDGFVAKLDPTGSTLLFSTYIGGTGDDGLYGIAVSAAGVWVGGETYSSDFPTTAGTLQTTRFSNGDGCICRLSLDGAALLASTYIGGTANDDVTALTLDDSGNLYATGQGTLGIVTTPGVFQPTGSTGGDAFVAKLAPDLKSRGFVTFLGGVNGLDAGNALALGPGGDVFVVGITKADDFPLQNAAQGFLDGTHDGFLARVAADGSRLVYSTYVGGTGIDVVTDLVVDGTSGEATILGTAGPGLVGATNTLQAGFGGGSTDAFVGRYAADGTRTSLSYLGGSGDETAAAIVRDASGHLWIAGTTSSDDFPSVDAEQPRRAGGTDAFVVRLDAAAATIEHATYLGGTGDDEAFSLVLTSAGVPYVVGDTTSTDLPTSGGALQRQSGGGKDAFVVAPLPKEVASFFLPKTVKATVNATTPAKSTVVVAGVYDTGPQAANLASAATLDVGGLHVPIPGLTLKGKAFTFAGNGFTFSILPNAFGSSRATFKLKYAGDLTNMVPLDGPLTLHFADAVADGGATVSLTAGKFALGKVKGSLVAPNLFLAKARANFRGAGKDTLAMTLGLATGGTIPAAASDLTIAFGGGVAATIPAGSFVRKANTDVFTGNVSGITKVTVDYARDQITLSGNGLDLGTYAQGGNSVLVSVRLGAAQHAVRVRMGRIGNTMKY